MMLEMSTTPQCSFLTLTYDDDHLPPERVDPETGVVWEANSVSPVELQRFMRTLRQKWKRHGGGDIRYFGCGEYGEQSGRPHYHIALFGFPPCCGSGPHYVGRTFVPCTCENCSFVSKIWGKGQIVLANLESTSAAYVCGYVTKKLTKVDDYTREILGGLHPEFARMSKRKGLGYDAICAYASKIFPYVEDWDDVPPYLVHAGKKWPLGRYLRNILGLALGLVNIDGSEFVEGENLERYKKNLDKYFEDAQSVNYAVSARLAGAPDIALKFLNAQPSLQLEKAYERNRKGKI